MRASYTFCLPQAGSVWFWELHHGIVSLFLPLNVLKSIRAAARRGDSEARCALAVYYLVASNPRRPKRAYPLLQASLEYPRAYVVLGAVLDAGLVGSQRQPRAAARMFKKAYSYGDPLARRRLALKFHWGDGVAQDSGRAVLLWQEGAREGDPLCMFHLAMAYSEGVGIAQSHDEAVRWMRAASLGGVQAAQRTLSDWYWIGDFVRRNRPAAVRGYLTLSAQSVLPYVARRLGFAYETGIGVAVESSAAIRWYHRAIRMGEEEALNDLGYMYLNGTCVLPSPNRALRYFRRAALSGSLSALYNLAETYLVLKEYDKAIDYCQQACAGGHKRAELVLTRLMKRC